MAGGDGRLMLRFFAPTFVVAALALGLFPLFMFAFANGARLWPDADVFRVTRFTLLQAAVSTALSVLPAILLARALARQRFQGWNFVVAILIVPLSLPAIVAVFGLTAMFGQSGWFGGMFTIYGLGGIVLAHVFFNLPLATRLLLAAFSNAPPESHRLASQLGFSSRNVFVHVDWPVLRPALPHIAALVFVLCASSFVIVLVLGGVAATTLEVAIYQSLRMDFDVARALALSLVQVVLSAALVLFAAKAMRLSEAAMSIRLQITRFDGETALAKLCDGAYIMMAVLLVGSVLLAVAVQGFQHVDFGGSFPSALRTSVVIGTVSTIIALPLVWQLSLMQETPARGLAAVLGLGTYAVPPAVIATGWFLAFRQFDGGVTLAVALIATMNALMALPFMLAVLSPALRLNRRQNDLLCAQLGIAGFNRLLHIDLPAVRSPLMQALLMAFVLSLGDLTAVTLLGAQGLVTLPSLVQQQMGHYQSQAAGGTALLLALLCLGLALLAQRFARA